MGGETRDVDLILLVLPKNWGGGHIRKIITLTQCVSRFPAHVPCFIVGAESTIPDENIDRYRMPTRDEAIRGLCTEVLKRSASIGVRGRITQRHLVELVGIDAAKVEIIFQPGARDNPARLQAFLDRNQFPLPGMLATLLRLQSNPDQIYEPWPKSGEEPIRIMRPYVTDNGDRARLNANIAIDGVTKTLWCETERQYQQYLLQERSDAFLAVLVPLAMRMGKDIWCEAPVSEMFLHNLNEILIPQLSTHDPRLHRTQVTAEGDAALIGSGNAVATGMSCGVDSLYTAKLYVDTQYSSMKLTHLYTGNYLYGNQSEIYNRARFAAQLLGLQLVTTYTNINEELELPHVYTHFFKIMFGLLALRKLFRVYYYSTAEDFSHFTLKDNATLDTALFELLLLYVFSMPDFQVMTGGVKCERLDKTAAIADFGAAQQLLNVCLYPELPVNCGRCGKCMRTLLMLDVLDSLDRFRATFDIDAYRASRLDSFVYLVGQKKSIMLAETYRRFQAREPLLIRQAEEIVAKRAG